MRILRYQDADIRPITSSDAEILLISFIVSVI